MIWSMSSVSGTSKRGIFVLHWTIVPLALVTEGKISCTAVFPAQPSRPGVLGVQGYRGTEKYCAKCYRQQRTEVLSTPDCGPAVGENTLRKNKTQHLRSQEPLGTKVYCTRYANSYGFYRERPRRSPNADAPSNGIVEIQASCPRNFRLSLNRDH